MSKKTFYMLLSSLLILCLMPFVFYFFTRDLKEVVSNRDFSDIQQDSILYVITDYNNINYYIDGQTEKGFQYEMIKAFAESQHLKAVFILENDLSTSIDKLKRGKADIVARMVPITTDFRDDVAYTNPIIQNKQILVQRTAVDNNGIPPIRSQIKLAGETLYVAKNSPYLQRIHNLSEEISDTIYVKEIPQYDDEQLMIMVAMGEIDYAVCNERIINSNIKKYPQLDVRTEISFTQNTAWLVRNQSPELLYTINKWLEEFKNTRAYRQICNRYL